MDLTPDEAAAALINTLTGEEKETLVSEVRCLLTTYPGADQRGLSRQWHKLGADWQGRELDLRNSLLKWIRPIEQD